MSGIPFSPLGVLFSFRSCVIRIRPHACMLHTTCGPRPSACQSLFSESLPNGCKSNGCHSKATRMRRTSSRRSISLHPGQNGRCNDVIKKHSKVRMSRYLDTSTKAQVAKIIVPHGRPVVPHKRNLYGHPLAGLLWKRTFEKVPLEHGWGKVPNWECLFVNRQKRTILVSVCGRYKHWLERNNILTQCGKYF